MNLTDKERAAMVKDLRQIARNYHRLHSHTKDQSDASLALNYEALAEALAERKPFEAVAERLSKGEKMTTKTPQEFAAFLESLRVKNEGPKTQEGWDFDVPINAFILEVILSEKQRVPSFVRYLVERIRRAEANAKPPTLVEDVKAFVREAVESGIKLDNDTIKLFRRLSEPSK